MMKGNAGEVSKITTEENWGEEEEKTGRNTFYSAHESCTYLQWLQSDHFASRDVEPDQRLQPLAATGVEDQVLATFKSLVIDLKLCSKQAAHFLEMRLHNV